VLQAYDASKQLIFALTPSRKSESLSTGELAAAGFLSAVPTTLITAPVERAKVLLQVISPFHEFTIERPILLAIRFKGRQARRPDTQVSQML